MYKRSYIRRVLTRYFCTKQKPDSYYDVIVVGAGHNGLVAAAYLAKNGLKTCVLERRSIIGGAAVTEEIITGFKFSRASYLLSLLRPQIYEDLELKKYGLEYFLRSPSSYTPLRKPHWRMNTKSLTLGWNARFDYDEIAKFSNRDAKKYFEFHEKLKKFVDCIEPLMDVSPHILQQLFSNENSTLAKLKIISRSKSVRNMLSHAAGLINCLPFAYEMMFTPATDIMDKWFETELLKATILTDACIGTVVSPDSIGSSYVLIHHVMGGVEQHKGAWAYPKGGMGAVSNAIAKCATNHGAHIFTDQEVREITLDDTQKVTGVITLEGNRVRTTKVLSNATPKVTFLNLLPAEILDAKFESRIRNIDYTSPVTKLNVALKGIPNFEADPNASSNSIMPHHRCTIHLNCESMNDILIAQREGVNGLLPKKPLIELTIPSSLDPTLCPDGCHVCLMFTQYTLYELHKGRIWDDETKREYANRVFDCVEEYAPGFKNSIVGYEILPPPDLERIFGLTGGHIFHGELTLDRLFFNRPTNWHVQSPYTPVEGLLLCGSGAHPGGGVTGSPGRLAALSVLSQLKK